MAVRREALRIFADQYADEADQEFQSALLDINVAIRSEAQYYFQAKLCDPDDRSIVEAKKYYEHMQFAPQLGYTETDRLTP